MMDSVGFGHTRHPGVVTVVLGVPAEGVLPQPLASNKICYENIMTANSRLAEKYQAAHPDIRNIKKP